MLKLFIRTAQGKLAALSKIYCFVFFLFLIFSSVEASAQVYFEDFNDEADDATTGTAIGGTWTSTCVGCPANAFAKQTIAGDEYFFVDDNLDNEGVWTSNVINISSFRDVAVYIETATALTETGDYLRVYYNLDNTGEVLFHSQAPSGGLSSSYGLSPTLNGSTLQIVVRAFNNANFEYFNFDNIALTNTLYSRATPANWSTSGTWSAAALGGVTCGCTPNSFTRVVIGNGHIVSINSASVAAGVTIQGTADAGGAGTLNWSGNFDLNLDQGGGITINSGGTLNAGANADARITFTDDVTHSIVNNGTLTIGDIVLTGPAFPDLGTLTVSVSGSGTLTVTDDITMSTSFLGPVFNNGLAGTFSVAGNLTVTDGDFNNNSAITLSNTGAAILSGGGTFTQGTNSSLTYHGSTLTITTFDAAASGNTVIYNSAGQTIANPSGSTYHHLTLQGSGTKTSSGNHIIAGNLTIGGTASFDVNAGTDDISVGGNWTVSSTNADPFVQGTRTVTLNGTAAQTISTVLAGGETFSTLTLNNSSATIPQITFNNTVTVTGTLNMTSGVVNLNNTAFTLGQNGATSDLNRTASTTTNWFYGGSFRRFWPNGLNTGNFAANLYGLYPLGTSAASSYRPFQVTSGGNITANGSYTVQHVDASTTTDLSPVYDDDPTAGVANIVRKHNAQFIGTVSSVTGGGNFTVAATMTGLSNGTLSDIRLSVSTGATTVSGVGAHVAATGTANNPTANRNTVTIAQLTNDFRITTTNSVATPLPVELVEFTAQAVNGSVLLRWKTAVEIDNHFFTVEKTFDFETFDEVGKIDGRGTSSEPHKYAMTDYKPFLGKSYYRLKQTDFDGQFTYSKPVMVEVQSRANAALVCYPNPSSGGHVTIEIFGLSENTEVPVQIYNTLGGKVYDSVFSVDGSGKITTDISFDSSLPAGTYIVKAGRTRLLTGKLLVH